MAILLILSASECWHFQMCADTNNARVSQTRPYSRLGPKPVTCCWKTILKMLWSKAVRADDKTNKMPSVEAGFLDCAAGPTGASQTETKSDRPRCWRKHDVIGQDIQYIIELSSLSHSFGGEGLTFCNDLQRTLLRSCKAVFVTNMSTAAEVFILLRLSLIKKRDYSTLFNGKKSHKLPRQVM